MQTTYFVHYVEAGKRRVTRMDDVLSHEDAILSVQEALVDAGIPWNKPFLTVIHGGKNVEP